MSHQADGVFAACAEIVVDVLAQVGEIRRDDAARQNQNGQEDDKARHFQRDVAGHAHRIAQRTGEQGLQPFPRACQQRKQLVADACVFGREFGQNFFQPCDKLVIQILQLGDKCRHVACQVNRLRNELTGKKQADAEQQRIKDQNEDIREQLARQPQTPLKPRNDRVEHPRHNERENKGHENAQHGSAQQPQRNHADNGDGNLRNQTQVGSSAFAVLNQRGILRLRVFSHIIIPFSVIVRS